MKAASRGTAKALRDTTRCPNSHSGGASYLIEDGGRGGFPWADVSSTPAAACAAIRAASASVASRLGPAEAIGALAPDLPTRFTSVAAPVGSSMLVVSFGKLSASRAERPSCERQRLMFSSSPAFGCTGKGITVNSRGCSSVGILIVAKRIPSPGSCVQPDGSCHCGSDLSSSPNEIVLTNSVKSSE